MKALLSFLLLSLNCAAQMPTIGISHKGSITPEMAQILFSDTARRIELDPANGDNYHKRGTLYLVQEEYENALADFTKAIELDAAAKPDCYFTRAVLKQTKKDPSACDDFAMAKKLGYQVTAGWDMIDEMCGFTD